MEWALMLGEQQLVTHSWTVSVLSAHDRDTAKGMPRYLKYNQVFHTTQHTLQVVLPINFIFLLRLKKK